MPARRKEPEFDEENPEWTDADFARARPAHEVLRPDVLSAFRNTRGPQKTPRKIPISIRLSPEVVEHFKASGPGWQRRIDDTLRKAAGLTRRKSG